MTGWRLVYEGFDPEQERLREALCTLGNGYFATRGAAPEARADGVHYPGTYLAGGYDRLVSQVAGREVENEDLVNMPNWLPLQVRFEDGAWLSFDGPGLRAFRQELDLLGGVLVRTLTFEDERGRRLRLHQRRLVHMRQMHLAALETTLEVENWSGSLVVRSGLDGAVTNGNVERYRALASRHLRVCEARGLPEEGVFLKVETVQSELRVALAARTRARLRERPLLPSRRVVVGEAQVAEELTVPMAPQTPVTLEKVVALYTSRDDAISECGQEAQAALARAPSFGVLLDSHRKSWSHLWRRFDMRLDAQTAGPEPDQLVIRLHVFHLLQTTSPNIIDLDVGVPARGLHGEAYRGHVFWDELFIFPFLNMRVPEITRALLQYRFRRLPQARAAAKEAGLTGALFPWQSGSNGREESQRLHLNPRSGRWIPDRTWRQVHVNAAIAYNVWKFFQVTGDIEFLAYFGAEMFLEIARLFAGLATFDLASERYELRDVMGPDEYHEDVSNNAYTNLMAVWVLSHAPKVLAVLPEERSAALKESLGLSAEELARWEDVSRRMKLVFHEDGVLSQFEGYEDLAELDWERYRQRYGDIQRLDRILEAEGDSVNRYKVSKQADVLMLFYLFSSTELAELFARLGYPFERDTIPKNIRYYAARTSHGSTLSRVVHAWVLARVDRAGSFALLQQAFQSDIADVQGGTTAEGIHLGAMAGTVDLLQRAYTGLVTRGEVLWFEPALPDQVHCLRLHVSYRGQSMDVTLSSQRLIIHAVHAGAAPIQVGVEGHVYPLCQNETLELPLES